LLVLAAQFHLFLISNFSLLTADCSLPAPGIWLLLKPEISNRKPAMGNQPPLITGFGNDTTAKPIGQNCQSVRSKQGFGMKLNAVKR
jgi:MinD superfamily P-loop ATPase